MTFSILVGLGGCSQKPQAIISLAPFTPDPAVYQKNGTIYLAGVKDVRKQKGVVGRIVKDGKIVTTVTISHPVDSWFKESIIKALDTEGCKVVTHNVKNANVAKISIFIDRLNARLNHDELTKENLEATARVTLLIEQGKKKITKHVGLTQKKWVPPFANEKSVREFLQETLESLVESVRAQIDAYRF
ncbi:YajG family lipoprotein [Hydrogenimonas urashimensis]|uniref:YajG family lipoprotein n=1 Tax=Hydrogenimonas urashimensis TaxID=2740515 RepID=UPI0019168685|nr:YajG family lipoprotein [Hydrogenimonas urashimensis]